MKHVLISFVILIAPFVQALAQTSLIDIDFSADTTEANGITVMGAGFGEYPLPEISYGAIPTDNAFEGATDGDSRRLLDQFRSGLPFCGPGQDHSGRHELRRRVPCCSLRF